MAQTGKTRTYVGFGFGPIQTGLMLLEAQASGNYGRYVIAEIDAALVEAVRRNGNRITVNIAHRDRIETRVLTGIEILNPRVPADRAQIVAAIAAADELGTAIPSVDYYTAGGDASIVALLAAGIAGSRPQILYACENNNYAAEILEQHVRQTCPSERLRPFQFLNTVIGKMSGVIQDAAVMERLGLHPMTPGSPKTVLVEAFNRILVSRVKLPGFRRGIPVFEEKDDLLPFEEAKLFGHNAIHALLGYLAFFKGHHVMSEVRNDTDLMAAGRQAFIDESGAALIRKHSHTGDALFTPSGYAAYADDLLERMTNPFLNDEIARVCRDPKRKLGYGDRLIGTMREALRQKIEPVTMARGAAAALRYAVVNHVDLGAGCELPDDPAQLTPVHMHMMLDAVWQGEKTDAHRDTCIQMITRAARGL